MKGGLCEGFPEEFQFYFNYVTDLEFNDDPDYGYLKGILKDLFLRMGYEYDNTYEWTKNKKKKQPEINIE